MYVGPWQEYKLMRVIEDLRGELDKQQQRLNLQEEQTGNHLTSSSNLPPVSQKEADRLASTRRVKPPFRVYETTAADVKQQCAYCEPVDAEFNNTLKKNETTNTINEHTAFSSEVSNPHRYQIKDVKEPTYGKNEERVLGMFSSDKLPPLPGHPLVRELARKVPLDTNAISARAGQKVYSRYINPGGKAASCPTSTRGDYSQSRPTWDSEDIKRKRLIERRMRLEALYKNGKQEPEEEEEEETVVEEKNNTMGPDDTTAVVDALPPNPAGEDAVLDLFANAQPPTPKRIEEDDIGGLLDWANDLDDAWLQNM